MQKRIVLFFIFTILKSISSYSIVRCDPFAMALEQVLSDITFEIVPYPTYPACQSSAPYLSNPYFYLDGCGQCQMYPDCSYIYDPYVPCQYPGYDCFDACPACSCYRDLKDPCMLFDEPGPLYLCFEGCNFDCIAQTPYIYFPQVEYPMSAMDIRPYYYGQCWCS